MAKQNNSGGIGFTGLLTIVFITLKLTEVIAWSWWWVFAPIWVPLLIVILIGVVVAILQQVEKK